jgi:hypothetical protein
VTEPEQKVFDLLPPGAGLQDPAALRPRLLAALREAWDEAGREADGLRAQVKGHCDRIAAQSELLSRRAEAPACRALLADLLDFVGTDGVVAAAYAWYRDQLCARLCDALGVVPGDAADASRGPPPPPESVTRYRLTLVLLPDAGWPDDGARLRQALKTLVRRYAIKCVLTEEL